jgi:hypothetical protein
MSPRTLFAWIFIAVLIAGGIFFAYHILLADPEEPPKVTEKMVEVDVKAHNNVPEMVVASAKPIQERALIAKELSEVTVPLQTPTIPAQTEADIKATRQVSETPPSVRFAEPEAIDPLEGTVHMESEFGDSLRHPEQTIEIAPPIGSMRAVVSKDQEREFSSMGGNRGVSYESEMGQNGGEFMQGIFAYDGSDGGGIGYSML